MAQSRTTMHQIRRIIELHAVNALSDRQISKLTGISRPTIAQYLVNWRMCELTLETFKAMSDSDALATLTMGSRPSDPRLLAAMTYFPQMAAELKGVGVTREVLWTEYRQKYPDGYTYSRFCHHYRVWAGAQPDNLSLHFEHKAGELAYYDWAGKLPLAITDPKTGLETHPEFFVSLLGASQYTYAEAFPSQKLTHWVTACRHSFEYFGGVPAGLVPDAYKGAVTTAHKYEPVNNRTFTDFADHYGTVILPARPYRPKDKALVEGAVRILYSRLFAPLRHRKFYSLEELNQALWSLLDTHNGRKFQRMAVSRAELWKTIDLPALKPLPTVAFEFRQYKTQKVANTYHVRIKEGEVEHFYSVPWRLLGQEVLVIWTGRTVEVYHDNLRQAFHLRSHTRGWSTQKEHMPDHHRFVADWSPERITGWAAELGPSVAMACQLIMDRFQYPEHGFKSCIGLISLGKSWEASRVNRACTLAMERGAPSYRAVKTILERDEDKITALPPMTLTTTVHENLRGQAAYK